MSVDRRGNPLGRLVFGAGLLTVGVLFLLDQMGRLDARDYFWAWWPGAFIAVGLVNLLQRRWAPAVLWTGIGVLFFLPIEGWEAIRILLSIWPLLISVAGLTLVMHALRSGYDANAFRAAAVMAGNVRTASTNGSAVAVMGGCTVDYGAAKNVTGELFLDVLAFWGGVEIRVPAGWEVVDRVAPILGGFDDKTVPARENAPRLVVRGSAIMGGVEVKSVSEAAA